jgi:hypothetical protein
LLVARFDGEILNFCTDIEFAVHRICVGQGEPDVWGLVGAKFIHQNTFAIANLGHD